MIKGRNNYILLAVSLILIIFSIYLWISRPLESKILNVEFIIDKNIGVNLNSSELNFGKVPIGGSVFKRVIIENNYEFSIKIKIFVSKSISDFILIEKEYVLSPEEKIFVPIILNVPETASFGNYSGKIKFEFRKA